MPTDYYDAPSWFYLLIGTCFIVGGTILSLMVIMEMAVRPEGTILMGIIFLLASWGFGGAFIMTARNVGDNPRRNNRRRR